MGITITCDKCGEEILSIGDFREFEIDGYVLCSDCQRDYESLVFAARAGYSKELEQIKLRFFGDKV